MKRCSNDGDRAFLYEVDATPATVLIGELMVALPAAAHGDVKLTVCAGAKGEPPSSTVTDRLGGPPAASGDGPIGVGFGIRDAATAKAVAEVADAVVIGSRIIHELENTPKDKAVAAVQFLVAGIRAALDSVNQK